MRNHYHLLLETPEPNLVAGMRWFQTTWTVRFNRRHGLCGHLFQGRYKAVVVNPGERAYFVTLSDYLHLNPVRARIVGLDQRLVDYPWSSYPLYVRAGGRPPWFEPRTVLAELGLADTAPDRRRYAQRMRERAVEALQSANLTELAALRRGWCLGSESFREKMLALLDGAGVSLRRRRPVDGAVRHAHDEARAQQLLKIGLEFFELDTARLGQLPKGDPRKLAIARVIREQTAVPNLWIARVLALGHVSRLRRSAGEEEARIGALARRLQRAVGPEE